MKTSEVAAVAGGLFGVVAGIGGLAVGTGAYNIAADAPHTRAVYWLASTVRDRSIAVRARHIAVPRDLTDPKRIAAGAVEYGEMCSGCHLAPGIPKTEISRGLCPRAPQSSGSECELRNLSRFREVAAGGAYKNSPRRR